MATSERTGALPAAGARFTVAIMLVTAAAAGLVAAYFGPVFAFISAAGALGALVVGWLGASPNRLLVVYSFLLPFDVYVSTSLRLTSNQIVQALTVGSWTLVMIAGLGSPRRMWPAMTETQRFLFLSLVLFLALSLSWTVSLEPSLRLLMRMLGAMSLFLIVATCTRSRVQMQRIVTALCLGAFGCALYGWTQFLQGSYGAVYSAFSPFYQETFTARGGGFQIVATFANPNDFAGFGCAVLPLFWAQSAGAGRVRARAGWALAGAALAGAVALTFSKTSWLVMAAMVALWFVARLAPSKKILAIGTLGIVFGTFVLLLEPLLGVFGRLFPNVREASVDARIDLWSAALRVFLERPLHGFGLDSFAVASEGIRSARVEHLVRAHNLYLQFMVDVGVAGTALYFAFIALVLGSGIRAHPLARDTSIRLTLLALLIGSSSFWMFACVDTLFSNACLNAYWLIFGLVVAASVVARESDGRNEAPRR